MNRALLAAIVAAPLIAIPVTALATPGPDHKTWVCHPVEGAGQNGYGWNLIEPDKASSHIDAYGVGKHTRKDGRTDVYAVNGKCPGSGNSSPPPSPSASPSTSPSASASPSATPSVTASPSTSPTGSPSPSPSVTVTPAPTDTPSPSASATPSGSASPTPSVTVTSPGPTEPTTVPATEPTGSVTATTPAPATTAPATTTTAAPQRPTVAHTDAEQLAYTGSHTWLAWIAVALLTLGGTFVAATRKGTHR